MRVDRLLQEVEREESFPNKVDDGFASAPN